MQNCYQTESQTIYQHGLSVRDHMLQLISYLQTGHIGGQWKLPDWLVTYRHRILKALLPQNIIEEYTIYHDCGKPYCQIIDADGKRHFPDHDEKSSATWLSIGGNAQAAKLMKMDMMIHTMKADDIDEFISHPEACTLLLAGLAEVHSNAKMFGGTDSISFKIKWNQINKRGKAICQKLFKEQL